MAKGTGTFDRYDLGNNAREQLSDVISNISPTEVPFCANAGVDSAKSNYEEWETDTLATAEANAHLDGDVFGAETLKPALRVGNYCMIGRKDIQVSGRADAIDKAGRSREMAYQMEKKGKELRRDVEVSAIARTAGSAGSSSAAPHTAGAPAWCYTNSHMGGGAGAAPASSGTGNNSGYPSNAGTRGNADALAEANLLNLISQIYSKGSVPNMILVGRIMKTRISKWLMSSGAQAVASRSNVGASVSSGIEVIGSVDVYVSDFGKHDFVPDLFLKEPAAGSDIPLLNTEYWKIMYFRRYKFIPQPNDGDASRELLLVDWGTKCMNEESSGCFGNVKTDAAMNAA